MTLRPAPWLIALAAGATLSACDRTPEAPQPKAKATPAAVASDPIVDTEEGIEGATPMAERVAMIGLLNKRNGLVRDLEMKPGEAIRVGRAVVRLRACETTPPWEDPPETGAFIQLLVQQGQDNGWQRVFSGWIFKERPERNVVEHPIYDVFVKSCTMRFPGGDAPEPESSAASTASSARQSPRAAPRAAPKSEPAPSPEPANDEGDADTAG